MKTIMDHLREAHARSGAPGNVTGFWGDGRYNVKLMYGDQKFRFREHADGRVTVFTSWVVGGARQRKQATSTKESPK